MNKLSIAFLIGCMSVFWSSGLNAQDVVLKKNTLISNVKPFAEAGTILSNTGETPFLLRRNQYGVVPLESQFFTLRAGLEKQYDSTQTILKNGKPAQKKFSFGYGLALVGNIGKTQKQLYLPEAYLKFRLGAFELYGGRRREITGLVDSSMTSGAFIWSGNALPLPKVQIGIPEYTPVLWDGLISVKGAYVHGWFGNSGQIKDFYLHQKWIYGRIGRADQRWKIYGGVNHQAQWGGYNSVSKKAYPGGFNAYMDVVFSLKEDSVTKTAAGNRVGNQLGTLDIAFEYNWKQVKLFIYRQNLYEQGTALVHLANIKDGLNGLSLINQKPGKNFSIKRFNFEYFYSMNQGRDPLLFSRTVAWELEDYFTSHEYPDGWTYKGKTIGTSLITPANETLPGFESGKQLINNNRIKAFQAGVDFKINQAFAILIQGLYTYNNGILIKYTPQSLKAEQFSLKIQGTYQFDHYTRFLLNLAADRGELYRENSGLSLMLQRKF